MEKICERCKEVIPEALELCPNCATLEELYKQMEDSLAKAN